MPSLCHALRRTRRPEWFQGHGRRGFFEGWYYKLIDAAEDRRYAIIPGVFLGRSPADSHAFIQALDGVNGYSAYHVYPIGDFWAAADRMEMRIGPNHFSADGIELDIARPEGRIAGALRFAGRSPWPSTLLAPGIMGWYAWMPFMECYHGVVSLDHTIAGQLTIDGTRTDFAGGRGYIEKDYGRAFPSAWVWLQTNHFETPGSCITASIAIIPWLRSSFRGFIIGVWHAGRLYRFATYTGAQVERLAFAEERVEWIVRDRRYRLEMAARRAEGGLLQAPTGHDMGRRIAESMAAQVDVRLTERAGGRLIFAGRGRNAGLEINGDLTTLAGAQGA